MVIYIYTHTHTHIYTHTHKWYLKSNVQTFTNSTSSLLDQCKGYSQSIPSLPTVLVGWLGFMAYQLL